MPSSQCAAAEDSARAPSCNASRSLAALAVAAALVVLTGCNDPGPTDFGAPTDAVEANGVIAKVVDGDTIDVRSTGEETTRIRMIGFNTPESVDPRRPVECFGKEASKHLASLAPVGTAVRLERDAEQLDRYGRTLAYVYRASDGMFLNLQMVSDGFAHALSIPPNITYADRFRAAERTARNANVGLWTSCPDAEAGS